MMRALLALCCVAGVATTTIVSLEEAEAQTWDAILVLGGGTPPGPREQLPFVRNRCEAADSVYRAAAGAKPKILCLSAGTAHVPQLVDARGSVVFESTASAATLVDLGVAADDVYVETTSFDTIGNAFFARTDHCSLAGWRRLLVITSEFHAARTRAIFDWVFDAAPDEGYSLSYLATPDAALSPGAVAARRSREAASAANVRDHLAPKHPTLRSVREFLVARHDLYSAAGLVARASRTAGDAASAELLASYGGGRPAAAPASRSRGVLATLAAFVLGVGAAEARRAAAGQRPHRNGH